MRQVRGGRRQVAAHRDRGSATAELAVALVALCALLGPLLAGLQIVVTAARAQEVARAVAREVARGDGKQAGARAVSALPGARTEVIHDGGDVTVTVLVPLEFAFGARVTVSRSAHAAVEQS